MLWLTDGVMVRDSHTRSMSSNDQKLAVSQYEDHLGMVVCKFHLIMASFTRLYQDRLSFYHSPGRVLLPALSWIR